VHTVYGGLWAIKRNPKPPGPFFQGALLHYPFFVVQEKTKTFMTKTFKQ